MGALIIPVWVWEGADRGGRVLTGGEGADRGGRVRTGVGRRREYGVRGMRVPGGRAIGMEAISNSLWGAGFGARVHDLIICTHRL